MFCQDCGVNFGSRVLIDGHVEKLCPSCIEDCKADGCLVENYAEARERWEDERADAEIAER